MWIEKQENGKYKYVEQYEDYMTGKKKRVSVTLEKSTAAYKKIAMETLVRMIEERQSTPPEKKQLTLSELVEKYRAYQKLTVKESTYSRNYHQCNSLMRILGKDVLIDHLTANYIKECFLATKKEAGTLNEHRVRLLALLNWAYENDYLADISFIRKFKPFKDKSHREKIQDKYLEQDELSRLISEMKHTKWRLLTKFLSLSGLRIGKLLPLLSPMLISSNI